MNNLHHSTEKSTGPETTGATIHWFPQYDFWASLIGLGMNGSNSCMVIEMAEIKPGDMVLDVGCGTGDLTLAAQKTVGPTGSAYGIDPSPEGVGLARKKAALHGFEAKFEVGLIEKLNFPEATFDVAISRLVIHHLPDDLKRRGFGEIYRVLKPGGRLFMVDFKPPSNAVLRHLASALVGHRMMMASKVWVIPDVLTEAGFVEVASGPTRSALMAFVSGKKPTAEKSIENDNKEKVGLGGQKVLI